MYLKLFKPLYGLSESEDPWFHKYNDFLKTQINLSTTDGDFYFHDKHIITTKALQGTMAVYADDMLASDNAQFENLTDQIPKTIASK